MERTAMTFPIDGHYKAYVCNHVFDKSKPILLVSRPEGDWCFLCGGEHENDASAYKVVGLDHVFNSDLSLQELADLPANWDAERKGAEHAWERTPYHANKY
jgi:hypothetical protein